MAKSLVLKIIYIVIVVLQIFSVWGTSAQAQSDITSLAQQLDLKKQEYAKAHASFENKVKKSLKEKFDKENNPGFTWKDGVGLVAGFVVENLVMKRLPLLMGIKRFLVSAGIIGVTSATTTVALNILDASKEIATEKEVQTHVAKIDKLVKEIDELNFKIKAAQKKEADSKPIEIELLQIDSAN